MKKIFKKIGSFFKKIFNKKNFTFKRILIYFGIMFALFVLTVGILFIVYAKDLPTPGKIKEMHPSQSTKITDRNGKVLYDFGSKRRTVIDFKDMPQSIKDATISAEDKDFYKELGFSITGILRSVYYNITGRNAYTSGGSTITQQYVKNALLTGQKTFDRKIKELILSVEIEFTFSKDQILAMYLNEIPYGSNAYGIEEAAKTYFGKSAKDLTLSESATLASLPKAPTYYSPYGSHPEDLKTREDYILDRMATLKYISTDQAKNAKEAKLTFVPFKQNIVAPHFVMYVKQKLIDMYGEDAVMSDGLKVTTTLDLDKQKIAEEAVNWGYERNKRYGTPNASLVSIDPKTGQILAMVGSHDFFDKANDGQVNVADTEQQPGSSFKPLVYATAFKEKYNPGYVLWDVTTDFGNYTPHNYNGRNYGPVTIRTALSNSLNIPAVKMLSLVGIDKALETAHEMGITSLNDPSKYGLSLVLGGGEVKLVDLTTAYGVFADSGTLHETTPLMKVTDNSGKVLYEYKENKGVKEVLDPQVSYEISNILSDNSARNMIFGALQANLSFGDRPVAVKTGTTQENRDGWTMGYTPSVVTGVWVGHNDNTPMTGGADGSVVAAPIWHRYMNNILKDTGIEQFSRPAGIKEVTVDKLSNKLPTDSSPEKITDIFASWQIPTENDDIHVSVKICKVCDGEKLATDLCPPDQTEARTYTNLHSERPDKPSWENPVISWAEANGIFISKPPTETCDLEGKAPTVNISSPSNNQTISGNFILTVDANSVFGVARVSFNIDNVNVGSDDTSPYTFNYDAKNLSTGLHEIQAIVYDKKGLTSKSPIIKINVIKDTTPPGPVTNVTVTSALKSALLNWKNPSDQDIVKARIYISTIPGNLGSKYPTEPAVTKSANTAFTITGLTSSVHYYFTIRPVDSSNNENQSTIQYDIIPL